MLDCLLKECYDWLVAFEMVKFALGQRSVQLGLKLIVCMMILDSLGVIK